MSVINNSLKVVIVEKSGELKSLSIKEFKQEDLFKKCGFKKSDDFVMQVQWIKTVENKRYYVQVYGKTEGRANNENKYDFPPPIDNKLLFGNCAILALTKADDGTKVYTDLPVSLWIKIYEKLFGGFEDLSATAKEDEEEEDELENIPKEMKTKDGYLKDGFVVDTSDSESDEEDDEDNEDYSNTDDAGEDLQMDDVGSELSEESYEYVYSKK